MKPFFTTNLKLHLQALGKQAFADDPKVVAVISHPTQDIIFYITEYRPEEGHFFGYIKGDGIDVWGSFPCSNIEYFYGLLQRTPDHDQVQLTKPQSISTFFPDMKNQMAMTRLRRLIEQRQIKRKEKDKEHQKKKDQDQDNDPER